MNRNIVVALSIAAVLGTTGGVALAVNQAQDRSEETPTAAASESPTPHTNEMSGQSDSTNEPLLWANRRQLHDGDTSVRLGLAHDVDAVVRMDGGWVVAERTSRQDASYALWWVTPDSTPSRFADIVGAWDADAAGRHVVAQAEDGKVRVWTPATRAVRTWSVDPDGAAYAGFEGTKVLVSMDNTADGFGWQSFLWDPATGTYADPGPATNEGGDTVSVGYPHMTVSPGGTYVAGAVGQEGNPKMDGYCLHVESTGRQQTAVDWKTCDWRLYGIQGTFSPDGTRLLAVPYQTDGFGPGLYGVIDASDGPRDLVAEVPMPDWTMLAQWADNDSLYVVRATDGDLTGYAIDRCDLDGSCAQVATSRTRPAVGVTR